MIKSPRKHAKVCWRGNYYYYYYFDGEHVGGMAGCQEGHRGTLQKHFLKNGPLGVFKGCQGMLKRQFFWAMAIAKRRCGCWGMMG
jgi:hypothetical protein